MSRRSSAPDDRARKIEKRRRVDARHLGRLTAEERHAILATRLCDTTHDGLRSVSVEFSHRKVVQKEQGLCVRAEQIVDAVIDEIGSDAVE